MATWEDVEESIIRCMALLISNPESVSRFAATCKFFRRICCEATEIGDGFWSQIPPLARPVPVQPERTTRDLVLRFASARGFAERMEALAPAHRAALGEDACHGCSKFPDADAYFDPESESGRGDIFFVRMRREDSVLWEGFLHSRMGSNGDVHLQTDDSGVFGPDLSTEFAWPQMTAALTLQPPRRQYLDAEGVEHSYFDISNEAWREEKFKMKRAMLQDLAVTVVMIKDGLHDRKLAISTSGIDADNLGPDGYCCAPHMEIMPRLSHGIVPREPLEDGFRNHPYYQTTERDCHCAGAYIALGLSYGWPRPSERNADESERETFVGVSFGGFLPRNR